MEKERREEGEEEGRRWRDAREERKMLGRKEGREKGERERREGRKRGGRRKEGRKT